jgi:hypothetical protein
MMLLARYILSLPLADSFHADFRLEDLDHALLAQYGREIMLANHMLDRAIGAGTDLWDFDNSTHRYFYKDESQPVAG